MKELIHNIVVGIVCLCLTVGLYAQSRPDLKNVVYVESKTGNKVAAHYIDSLFAAGRIAFPDSTKVVSGVSYYFVTFWNTLQLVDVRESMIYKNNIGKSIFDGETVFASYGHLDRNSLAGKVCLFHFWATTCGPCIKSLKELDTVFKKELSDNRLAVFNFSQENEAVVDKFLHQFSSDHLPGSFINSCDPLFTALAIEAIPTLVIVDKKGVVNSIFIGQGGNLEEIKDAVRKVLQ